MLRFFNSALGFLDAMLLEMQNHGTQSLPPLLNLMLALVLNTLQAHSSGELMHFKKSSFTSR